jgi:hypothetical protein
MKFRFLGPFPREFDVLRLTHLMSSYRHLGCLGAAIIILIHGFETFSQQMVVLEQRLSPFTNASYSPAPVPARSEAWDHYLTRGFVGGEDKLQSKGTGRAANRHTIVRRCSTALDKSRRLQWNHCYRGE